MRDPLESGNASCQEMGLIPILVAPNIAQQCFTRNGYSWATDLRCTMSRQHSSIVGSGCAKRACMYRQVFGERLVIATDQASEWRQQKPPHISSRSAESPHSNEDGVATFIDNIFILLGGH